MAVWACRADRGRRGEREGSVDLRCGQSQHVIEAALHLAEMDFDLDVYSLWQKHQRLQQTPTGCHPPAAWDQLRGFPP